MTVDGIQVEVSHPDKLLFPDGGISKGELAEYYARIADRMLPYLEGRPISMERYPDGIQADGFYQKKAQGYFPDWVHRITIELKDGGRQEQVSCENAATLVFLADQGCITPHVWLSREGALDRPDRLIFDLDPPGEEFGPVREAARLLLKLLERIRLRSFPMLTGSRGLHVVVPLDGSEDFDTARELGQVVAARLAAGDPERLTDEVRKAERGDRVFIDVARNAYGQTAVPPYAVRARPGAPVAVPIEWDELSSVDSAYRYSVANVFRRLAQKQEPWRDMEQRTSSAARALQRMRKLPETEDEDT